MSAEIETPRAMAAYHAGDSVRLIDEAKKLERELKDVQSKLQIAREALKQLQEPAGAYRKDRLEHACNVIDNVKAIATAALAQITDGKEKERH